MNDFRLPFPRLLLSLLVLGAESVHADEPHLLKPFEDRLADLLLLTPPWESATVYRESVVPLQFEEDDPITGRLPFQVDEILAVRCADGRHILVSGKAIELARIDAP